MEMDYFFLKDKLKGEYAKAFDKVELYTSVRNIDGSMVEDLMMNLLDMLLSAQNDNKPVEKILGKNIEKFCESYFEGYDFKTRLKDQIPKRVYSIMWIVFIIEMLDLLYYVNEENVNLFKATTDISGYMFGLLCGVIIIAVSNIFIKPFIFRWKKISSTAYSTLVFIVLVGMLLGYGIFMEEDMHANIPIFPVVIISGGYITIYYIVRAVSRYKDHGSIWKGKKIFENSWFKKINESSDRQLPNEFAKRYHKMNRKRIRRGKEEMTSDEFTEKIRKETENTAKFYVILAIILIAYIAGSVIYSAITESILDAAIYAVLLCAIEAPIFYFFWACGVKSRRRLLEECDKKGVNIVEYAERIN